MTDSGDEPPRISIEAREDAPLPASEIVLPGRARLESELARGQALLDGTGSLDELAREYLNGHDRDESAGSVVVPEHVAEALPMDAYLAAVQVPMPGEDGAPLGERKVGEKAKDAPLGRVIDFAALAGTVPPEFRWFVPGWLSPHPTLMSGKGGVGKSLAALQMAVALASGKPFLGAGVEPLRVVLWSCEEDMPELHRRLYRICGMYGIDMVSLADHLLIDCRHGLDNTLMTQEFGRPMWTGLTEYLREQVGDFRADVWIGDNVAHMYACSENERNPVTVFTSWLSGLRGPDVSWCPLLIGHVAKVGGSEYSGSTAWENAVRMRWYLGERLPGEEKNEESDLDVEAGNIRFLCKRKSNYDQRDYVRFRMADGLLVPEQLEVGDTGMVDMLRKRKARDVMLRGLAKLAEMGVNCTERGGQANACRLVAQYGLAEGCSPRHLTQALRELMVDGAVVRGETGRDAFRRRREGLILVNTDANGS